jgi:ATP-dependent exoDNAse (exonuclease V) beta subunit
MSTLSDLTKFDIFNRIKFYEKNHTYKIDGELTSSSVTRFLNLFSPPFDRDAIAKNIAKRNNVDLQTVLNEWEYEKDIACLKGTIFHNYIDNYLHNKIIPVNKEEILQFYKGSEPNAQEFMIKIAKLVLQFESFYEYYNKRFIHFKSEFVVGDINDTRICGTIDNLSLCRETDTLFIIDYKTNKKFTEKNSFGKYLTGPVSYLEDTKLNVYGLQLHMYKYIVEKYTDFKVKCLIVWFNENNDTYKLFTPPDLSKEIVSMVDFYKNKDSLLTTKVTEIEDYITSIAD